MTSLLDEVKYPTADFKEIYGLRWGVETFYGVVKTRLQLENFTGKTVESIRQDFHATIYITGLESILTHEEMDPNYWAVGKVKSLVGFRPPDQG